MPLPWIVPPASASRPPVLPALGPFLLSSEYAADSVSDTGSLLSTNATKKGEMTTLMCAGSRGGDMPRASSSQQDHLLCREESRSLERKDSSLKRTQWRKE
ncbi:hypothetical protein DPEC_G00375960, partial [Dallia pectoralis]